MSGSSIPRRPITRRTASVSLSLLFSAAAVLGAQPSNDFVVRVYHGGQLSIIAGGDGKPSTSLAFTPRLPVGSRVCFDVANANLAHYRYAIDTASVTESPHEADLAPFLSELALLFPAFSPGAPMSPMSGPIDPKGAITRGLKAHSPTGDLGDTLPTSITDYLAALTILGGQVRDAEATGAMAEPAGPFGINPQTWTPSDGFADAREAIGRLPREAGQFNDPELKGTLDKWKTKAHASLPPKPSATLVALLAALDAYGKALLHARDELKAQFFVERPYSTRVCETLGDSVTRFTLRAEATSLNAKPTRWVSTPKNASERGTVAITPTPLFRKPVSELLTTFMVLLVHAPQYKIDADNRVRRRHDFAPTMRPASVLSFPLGPRYIDASSSYTSIVLGIGHLGENRLVSDLHAGVLYNLRNIRIGLTLGVSWVNTKLTDASEGDPLPAGKQLDDLLTRDTFPSAALTFSLPGLDVSKRFGG